MTSQLDEARRDNERHRGELEAARAYLESILASLSAGVLVFDQRFVLRTVNEGALTILADDFTGLLGEATEAWPRQQVLGQAIRDAFAERRADRMAGAAGTRSHRRHCRRSCCSAGTQLPKPDRMADTWSSSTT
jgi:nitrogen fixation/metabolism regulation signal transduction histidine kinase